MNSFWQDVRYSLRQLVKSPGFTTVTLLSLALGAESREVFRLVLSQGLRLAVLGISIGLVVSLLLTRFLKDLLFGVKSTDVLTFSSVSVLLCLVALLACFVPAWRATKVDPMIALRYQ